MHSSQRDVSTGQGLIVVATTTGGATWKEGERERERGRGRERGKQRMYECQAFYTKQSQVRLSRVASVLK